MEVYYTRSQSKRTASSWINLLIKRNIDLHTVDWKKYCDLIQELSPNDSNNKSQIHQGIVHEVQTFQKHATCIPQEQYKWFIKHISEFSKLNISSLATWIATIKKVIRLARRRMKQDKQHRLTDFFPYQN